jgi:hypothetical protein
MKIAVVIGLRCLVSIFFSFSLSLYVNIPNTILVGGCNPSEKYEFVSWDYSLFPINMESQSIHVSVTTKQYFQPGFQDI